jgi:hypothetical protein
MVIMTLYEVAEYRAAAWAAAADGCIAKPTIRSQPMPMLAGSFPDCVAGAGD